MNHPPFFVDTPIFGNTIISVLKVLGLSEDLTVYRLMWISKSWWIRVYLLIHLQQFNSKFAPDNEWLEDDPASFRGTPSKFTSVDVFTYWNGGMDDMKWYDAHLLVLFPDSTLRKLWFRCQCLRWVTYFLWQKNRSADVLGNLWCFRPSYCGPGRGSSSGTAFPCLLSHTSEDSSGSGMGHY